MCIRDSDQPGARMVAAAKLTGGDAVALAHRIMAGLWEEQLATSQPDVLARLADDCGLDGFALIAASEGQAVSDEIAANTQTAIETGVFGMPWYDLNGEPFWGQDRLDFLEHALQAGSDG